LDFKSDWASRTRVLFGKLSGAGAAVNRLNFEPVTFQLLSGAGAAVNAQEDWPKIWPVFAR
jgi:hypothetical protein